MKVSIYLVQIILAASTLLFSMTASAQQWYHIELVMFERLSGANAETWPEMTSIRQGSLSPNSSNKYIQPAATGSLSGVVSRLNNSANYRVQYYKAWNQPIMSKGSAKSVRIESDNGLIEGALRLYRMSYMHADIDVWFKENGFKRADSAQPQNPQLKQIQRIKSKKLIYLDHPRIAAILELTPIATPAVAVSKTPESYSLQETASATENE